MRATSHFKAAFFVSIFCFLLFNLPVLSQGSNKTQNALSPSLSVPFGGLKIERKPHDKKHYTLTLHKAKPAKETPKTEKGEPLPVSSLVALWTAPTGVTLGTQGRVVTGGGEPELVMSFGNPQLLGEDEVQFDVEFLPDEKTGRPRLPAALEQGNVYEVQESGVIELGPLVEVVSVVEEDIVPFPPLKRLNTGGEIKALASGKDQAGPYVDITFTGPAVPEFESTPLLGAVPSGDLEDVVRGLNLNLGDSVLALTGNDFPFVSTIKPKYVKVVNPQTLRVGLELPHRDAIAYYEKIFKDRLKHHKEGAFRGALAVFADYSAPPATSHHKAPAKKEETFFLFADEGVTFQKSTSKPGSHGKKAPYTVVFHGVDKVMGVDRKGGQRTYTDGDITRIVGHGKKHPFKPNGLFVLATGKGKPQYVLLSFDKAHHDPKSRSLTFDVSFLHLAHDSKGAKAVPPQFMHSKPVTLKGKIKVYLDFGVHDGPR